MPTAKTDHPQTQILDEAAEAYFQTMRNGLRLQEEFAARWSKTLRDSMSAGNWWEQMQSTMSKATMQTRENTEQILKMLEHGSRDGSELINKAFDAARVSTPLEAQYKLQQLWEASLKALNANAQIMVQTNAKLMQDWLDFMQRSVSATGTTAAKATAAAANAAK